MEFTVTAIAEKVEIDYNSEYPGDGIRHTGIRVIQLTDIDGNRFSWENQNLKLNLGDKVVIK